MSQTRSTTFSSVFPTFPKSILDRVEISYDRIKKNFRESRYESSELNGAKFCEAVYRMLEWHTFGSYTQFGNKIKDFGREVKKFENLSNFPDSIRFHIPRILDALYGIRNKRGVGHLGGDVDPNHMDAIFVVSASDWVLAELVRLFHGLRADEAQEIVEKLVTKQVPIIWQVGSIKRVLDVTLAYKDKTLAILYGEHPKPVSVAKLFAWVEHSNLGVFKRDILRPCHKSKLIEFDESTSEIVLSPLGLRYVEENINLEF